MTDDEKEILEEMKSNPESIYFDACCALCHQVKLTHFFNLKTCGIVCLDCLRKIKRIGETK